MSANKDAVAAMIWVGVSILVYVLSLGLPAASETAGGIGPAYFPRLMSIVIGFLAIILLYTSAARRASTSSTTQVPTGGGGAETPGIMRRNVFGSPFFRATITMATIAVYIASIGFLGYLVSTFLFCVVFLLFQKVRKPTWLVLGPMAVSLGVYTIFRFWLGVPLPRGILL